MLNKSLPSALVISRTNPELDMYLRRDNVNTLFPGNVVSVTELISVKQADSAGYASDSIEYR